MRLVVTERGVADLRGAPMGKPLGSEPVRVNQDVAGLQQRTGRPRSGLTGASRITRGVVSPQQDPDR
jgi:hypothetical protein